MINKILNNKIFATVVLALFVNLVVAFADQPPPVDYQRNDGARSTTTSTNGIPGRAGITKEGAVYAYDLPGLAACSAANTGTTAINILTGTAGVSHTVSRVDCANNSTVASVITLKENVTTIGSSIIGTTTLGSNKASFVFPQPIPVEGAKTLNFTMATNATSTICCANYVDVVNLTPTPTPTPTP